MRWASNALQAVINLIRNAFFNSILPGLEEMPYTTSITEKLEVRRQKWVARL
jgi:hypothetical protein